MVGCVRNTLAIPDPKATLKLVWMRSRRAGDATLASPTTATRGHQRQGQALGPDGHPAENQGGDGRECQLRRRELRASSTAAMPVHDSSGFTSVR